MKKFPIIGKNGAGFSNHWKNRRAGFTLLELLAVLGVVALMIALLLPFLLGALESGRSAQCKENLRQLVCANTAYAAEHGTYVAAAADIMSGNNLRWHGRRASASAPFDGAQGPLAEYLGASREIRMCPSMKGFSQKKGTAFERACGGYGYNDRGVGSQVYLLGRCDEAMRRGMPPGAIRDPGNTVMFADTGFPQPYGNPKYLIEYSFAEAYFFVDGDPPTESGQSTPSIHFRHKGCANVAWCDGHVSAVPLPDWAVAQAGKFKVGWIGEQNNA